jgi:hypothetical protein
MIEFHPSVSFTSAKLNGGREVKKKEDLGVKNLP